MMAVATIACGIGALTAVFTLVNAVLLEPLPYPGAGRLIVLVNAFRGQASRSPYVSAPRVRAWREHALGSQDVAVYTLGSAVNVAAAGQPRQANGAHVNADFFPLFGARLAQGRFFTEAEDRPGQVPAVVISHAWWQQLGGDDGIIGESIVVNGEPATMVGVLDEEFDARSLAPGIVTPPDIWLPLRQEPDSRDDANNLLAVTRLAPNVSIEVVRQQARVAAESFRAAFPGELRSEATFDVIPLKDVVVGDIRRSLLMLAGAVGLVAMLVSANTANLLLARASARRREFAIRVALGASRWRLVRQLLMEGSLLSVIGGIVGGALGVAGVRFLLSAEIIRVPRIAQLGISYFIDARILLLVCIAVLAIGVAISLAPASTASRSRDGAALDLRDGQRVGPDRHHRRVQALLLAGEAALACVVLIGAVLLMRSFVALDRVNPGFERADVVTMQTASGDRGLSSPADALQVFQNGLDRLAVVPGVESATVSLTGVPLAQGGALRVDVVGRSMARQYMASWDLVAPSYFDVFRIRLITGRLFDDRDRHGATPIVVINETLARQLWPAGSPLGERILIGQGGGPAFEENIPRQVVGVVADVRQFGLGELPLPGVYVPLAQMTDSLMPFVNRLSAPATWAVRTVPAAMVSASVLQRELLRSTGLPAARVRTMEDVFSAATASTERNTWLLGVLGVLALLVAVSGVYAVAAHSVQQRTHEMGVRLAIGAQAWKVRRMVVWESVRLVLAGAAVGLTMSAGLSTVLAALLFGVSRHDPLTFGLVPGIVLLAALVGAYLPARRASRIDPLAVLRE
jgi:predicted permease